MPSPVEAVVSNTLKEDEIIFALKKEDSSLIYSLTPRDAPAAKELPFALSITDANSQPLPALAKYELHLPAYLTSDGEIYVVISTLSGVSLAQAFADSVLKPILNAAGLDESKYTVITTQSVDSVGQFTTSTLLPQALAGRKQTVLMLSGDGGVVDMLNSMLRDPAQAKGEYILPTLVQFPLGTGNALYHSNHRYSTLSSPFVQALRTLFDGCPRRLPLFEARFSPGARLLTDEGRCTQQIPNDTLYGAVVASYGLHSTLVADSDTAAYRQHGDKRFGMVAQDLLHPADGAPPHAYRARLTLSSGGSRPAGMAGLASATHAYILATLVSHLQETFCISPASRPLQGQMRIVHFGPVAGERAMEIMMAAYQDGKHVESPEVTYQEVDGLRVDFDEEDEQPRWRRCCIDGSIVAVERAGWMEVRTLASEDCVVNVVVPRV